MIQEDTISAIATAPGESGIGIIRLSGPNAVAVADRMFKGITGKSVHNIKSFQAAYGHIIDCETGLTIDEVLVLVMRAPRSYTREDIVEIHCHGGIVPLQRILDLTLQHGARLAEPGEFTKRAFLNGRLDLTQAEAVIDIIRAKTASSLKVAVNQLSGRLSKEIRNLRDEILAMIAHLEAAIDFPEDDIEEMAAGEAAEKVEKIISEIDKLLSTAQTGRILREGLSTVIIGRPNVGKSSLLNALLREQRAIVTDIPGTTRDTIEEYVNIRGIPLKIVDTAGIRETNDLVEKIGVERTKEVMLDADLILVLLDASEKMSHEDEGVLSALNGRQAIILVNKCDLPRQLEMDKVSACAAGKKVLPISAVHGTGMEELEQLIVDLVYSGQVRPAEDALVNNVRQAHLLEEARHHLKEVVAAVRTGLPPDCLVIDLRNAWDKLGKITGDTVGEDILNEIFTRFCIGK